MKKIAQVTGVKIRGRLAFPALFEPSSPNGEGEPRYSAHILFAPDSDTMKTVQAAIAKVAKEQWDEEGVQIAKELLASGRCCLRSGDKSYDGRPAKSKTYDGYAGMWFVAASNKKRPLVVDRDASPLTADDGRPYGGCYVVASIDVWAQDNRYGRRINATLAGVQFERDGEAFGGGRVAAKDEFEPLSDENAPAPWGEEEALI